MKTLRTISVLFFFVAAGVIIPESCQKVQSPDHKTTPLAFQLPPGFPQAFYNFSINPMSEEAFLLGRKLFYDGRLSIDGSHSCASCHQQNVAFTTANHDLSHGINGQHTLRNAPGLFNLAWYPYFNQDGGKSDLESVLLGHIRSSVDMGETTERVIAKLSSDTAYKRMFNAAYGSSFITERKMLNAIKQYLLNLVEKRADGLYNTGRKRIYSVQI